MLAVSAALGARPALIAYHLRKGRTHLVQRQSDEALAAFQQACALDPRRAETHFWLARAYRRLGRFDEVRMQIEDAWKLGHPVRTLKREQWLALAQAGQMADAEVHLGELLSDPGDDGQDICEAYSNGYFIANRILPAMKILEAWERDFPNDSQPHVFRGRYWEHIMAWAEAGQEYRRALELAPDRHEIRTRLAEMLLEIHQFAEAREHFRLCLEQSPDDPEVLAGWGQCLRAEGNDREARDVFARVLAAVPDHVEARLAMGQLELTAGKPRAAIEWLRGAAAKEPYNYDVRYALAAAFQAAGDETAAREHYKFVDEARQARLHIRDLLRALVANTPELNKQQETALRYDVGVSLLRYGKPVDAAAWLQSVLELQPDHRPAHQALADYYAGQGNAELAERHRRLAGAVAEISRGS